MVKFPHLVLLHVYPSVWQEIDAFRFQQSFPYFGVLPARDAPVCHDDPLPGQMVGAAVHSPPDFPGAARFARQKRDLAV